MGLDSTIRSRIGIACAASIALVGLALGACATVDVQKIDADGNAVGPKGVRFNRGRPYVAVYEAFVVSARPHIVEGVVSPDGQFVVITGGDDLDGVRRGVGRDKIETSGILLSTPETGGGLQGASDSIPAPERAPQAAEPGSPPEKTGQGSMGVTNDNSAFATQPLRRYCDIVYLPDFEEEFVVQVEERMGNASATLQLGQGWSMQGLDWKVDNSAITDRVFALYDESIKLLLTLGRTALGIPGPIGGLQGAREPSVARMEPGTTVSLKVTLVRVVAPGVYPILKPSEGKYVNDNIDWLRNRFPGMEDRILVPVYPMTNIAFNTYTVAVIEAARPVGESPLTFSRYQDTTGTGTRSAAQGATHATGAGRVDLSSRAARAQVETALAEALNAAGRGCEKVEIGEDGKVTVTARAGVSMEPATIKSDVANFARLNALELELVKINQ